MRRFLKLFKCKEHIYKTNTLGKSVACFRKSIAPKVGLYAINANYIAPRKAKKMDIKKKNKNKKSFQLKHQRVVQKVI